MSNQSSRVGRQSIIEQAERLFTEYGYQSVSIRQIADACGVTNAALYYHFDNKAALFSEVIQHHARSINQSAWAAAEQEETYLAKVQSMARVYLTLVSEKRPFMNLIRIKDANQGDTHLQDNLIETLQTVFGPFDQIIQQAQAAGELVDLPDDYSAAAILVGMLHGLGGHKMICHHEMMNAQDIDYIVELFWRGMVRQKADSLGS
jgi:AcrR family transcriptional regulator